MSGQEHWYNEGAPPVDQPVEAPPGVNGLGIAGFVVGLVSLCGCSGLLSPVGLILSIIGLFKPPRGWAVAGTIVSVLGCCVFPFGLVGLLLFAGAISVSAFVLWIERTFSVGPGGQTALRVFAIVFAMSFYVARSGSLPASLDDLDLDPAVLTDGWGHPFIYEVDDQHTDFTLTAPGGDGVLGTGDDIEFEGSARGGALQFDTKRSRPGRGAGTPAVAPMAPPPAPTAPASSGTP